MEAALDFSRPIIHESERYEFVRKIGAGSFGEARLMKDKLSAQFVAIKYLERGDKVSFSSFLASFLQLILFYRS